MMKIIQWIVLVTALSVSVFAEVRLWTDEDGVLFEGEFVKRVLGRIQVKGADGTRHMISEDKLAKADLVYLQTTIPPEIDIKVTEDNWIRPQNDWSIEQDFTTFYTYTVTLEKEGSLDSSVKLTAELYVIADEIDGDNWVLAERGVSKFVFPEGKDSVHKFTVKNIPFRSYFCGWIDGAGHPRGVEHVGYFLAVLDSKDTLIAYDTDIQNEDWMDLGEQVVADKLRALYLQGRGSQFSRHFDETIQKSKLPRVPFHERTQYW